MKRGYECNVPNLLQLLRSVFITFTTMKVKTILGFLVGIIMVAGFLGQMWEIFDQFHSGLKTIAVSFEERDAIEFPSFAICDSRAFRKLTPLTANAARYNATTFNLEEQVSLHMLFNDDLTDDWNTYTTELLPTIYNGYCMLYEFQRHYPVNAWAGKARMMQDCA